LFMIALKATIGVKRTSKPEEQVLNLEGNL